MYHTTLSIWRSIARFAHLRRCACGVVMICTLLCVAACSGASRNGAGPHNAQGPFSGIAVTPTATTTPANGAAAAAIAGDGGDDVVTDTPATPKSTLVPVQAATATPTHSAITPPVANKIGAALLPANVHQQTDALILDMLTNIKANGYNSATSGLWINWRYGSNPLQTNFNGSGQP
ncbi:MAG TPA: hypothetical protein VKB76_14205, partial [Ktedonobacterales bacterium]|nr:hypothetical protein [Ktedonobacterales bacterium]